METSRAGEKLKTYSESELSKLASAAFESYAKINLPELLKAADGSELSIENYIERRDAAYGNVLAGGTLTGEGKPGDAEANMKMHLTNLSGAAKAIQENKIFGGADEILLPYLDSLYKESIDGKDHTIFMSITKWQSICPESRNDKALQEQGEGSLSKNLGGKRGASDFAMWKKSKAGEPVWPSPWGEGRPGWHIECSVMASDVLGSKMDMHSGGIDLAFPHHDNELALSEAYFCEHSTPHNWVNYFLHMGHLSITGSKMSKSLKNFQTIKDALKTVYTPRGLRIVFLMSRWNNGVEISPDMRTMAEGWESTVNNFFVNVKSLLLDSSSADIKSLSISDSSCRLQEVLDKSQAELRAALSDSFDTPRAMRVLGDLIKEANIHINTSKSDMDTRGLDKLNAKEIIELYSRVHKKVTGEVKDLGLHSEVLDKLMAVDVDAEVQTFFSSRTNDPEALAMLYLRTVSKI
ncbi:hypothetical protein B7494_g6064 [Chlorociboria aeruginascens]|nr:hypothetical protein B7494_g6064 [Chlorociboria aeruginascens]